MKRVLIYTLLAILIAIGCIAFMIGGEPPQPPLATTGPRVATHFAGIITASPKPMRAVAFSPDGSLLASTGVDGAVRLVTIPAGKPVHAFTHPGGATALAWAPDGRFVATAGYDGNVRLWRVADGTVRLFGISGQTLWAVAFSPDGTLLAAAGEDKLIHIWRTDGTGQPRTLAGHARNIWDIAFSPDGRTIASGSFDRMLKLWDVAPGRLIRTVAGHSEAIVGLDIRRGDGLIATGGDDATIRLWRADGAPVRTMAAGQYVDAVAFSADGEWLASGGRESHGVNAVFKQLFGRRPFGDRGVSARLWRVSDGAMIAAFNEQSDDVVAVAISPDSHWLASGSDDGTVALWELHPER